MPTSEGALRWGILGTGNIATKFADDLTRSATGRVVAVGSRTGTAAQAFCERFVVPRGYGNYEQLVADDEVEAVYVALPNPLHHVAARAALEAGKAVLVEKPFTVNLGEALDLVQLARERHLFVMEGMWTRCLPHFAALRGVLDSGRIGDVRLVIAEHGIGFPLERTHRIYDPELAGGALLDLGVYVLWLASFVFGHPEDIVVDSAPAMTGVDAQTAMILSYSGGRQAVLTTSTEALLSNRAVIAGRDGRIEIEGTWYRPTRFSVIPRLAIATDGEPEVHNGLVEGNGLRFEAEEVARCLRAGLTESPLVPLDETLAVTAAMDEVRRSIALRYPFELSL